MKVDPRTLDKSLISMTQDEARAIMAKPKTVKIRGTHVIDGYEVVSAAMILRVPTIDVEEVK